MEVPWFAERSIHLSLLAAQARGIPIQVPTDSLLLPHPAAHTERQSWGAGAALAPSPTKAPSWVGLEWGGPWGWSWGWAWQLLWHERNHTYKVKVSFKVMGAGLLWAQMLSLLFLSCADPRKGSDLSDPQIPPLLQGLMYQFPAIL